MLTRRAFFGGACCLLHAGPALAEKRSRPRFICATSDEKWLEPGEIPMAQASLYPLERWTPNHNFTRDQRLITLNVGFMGGTREQKRTVQRFASEWIGGGLEKHIRFVFDTSLERSHIRVSFKKNGGNVSEVGARADHVPKSKPTMNLADLTRRAILHEFGHALGLRHEHHHPEAGIVWNRPAVLARYREHGWSDKKIEENVFRRFNKNSLVQRIGVRSGFRDALSVRPGADAERRRFEAERAHLARRSPVSHPHLQRLSRG